MLSRGSDGTCKRVPAASLFLLPVLLPEMFASSIFRSAHNPEEEQGPVSFAGWT